MRVLVALTLSGSLAAASLTAQQAKAPAPAPKQAAPRRAAAPPTAPKREAPVPFAVGETLTYDVGWGRFITAGTATTRVIEKKASYDSTAYMVSAEGRPLPLIARLYPLFYKMDSLIDSYSLLSQWSALYTEEGTSKKRLASTRFDRAARLAHYEIQNEPSSKDSFAVPAEVQDGLTLLYILRTRATKAGERFTVPIADDGSMYTIEVASVGTERVKAPLGETSATNLRIRITDERGKEVGSNVNVWLSQDARRLPLKLQAELPVGSFLLTLREAR
jgi:hypothetical protein